VPGGWGAAGPGGVGGGGYGPPGWGGGGWGGGPGYLGYAPPPVPAAPQVWTEHAVPDGRKYYYNSVTGVSVWSKPEELMTPEVG